MSGARKTTRTRTKSKRRTKSKSRKGKKTPSHPPPSQEKFDFTHLLDDTNDLKRPRPAAAPSPSKRKVTTVSQFLVAVGTLNPMKCDAVSCAVKDVFPEAYSEQKITVVPMENSVSGINEQPVGLAETLQGARNRISHKKKGAPSDISVGIENGIVELGPGSNLWIDLAVVVVKTSVGEFISTSAGVQFPSEFVEQARSEGFESTSVGSVIARRCSEVSKTNPHCYLTKGYVQRKQLVQNAVRTALCQWQQSEEIKFSKSDSSPGPTRKRAKTERKK